MNFNFLNFDSYTPRNRRTPYEAYLASIELACGLKLVSQKKFFSNTSYRQSNNMRVATNVRFNQGGKVKFG